jgi:hypothetical protein
MRQSPRRDYVARTRTLPSLASICQSFVCCVCIGASWQLSAAHRLYARAAALNSSVEASFVMGALCLGSKAAEFAH